MKNLKLILVLAAMVGIGGVAFNNCSDVGFADATSQKASGGPGGGDGGVAQNDTDGGDGEGDGEGSDPRCTDEAVEAGHCAVICHIPPGNPAQKHTLRVGAPAVPAHLAHGDYEGECKDDEEQESESESQ